MTLGDQLRRLRENAGQSRREAADLLGISYASISKYEQGARNPDLDLLVSIADLYGVTTDFLLERRYQQPAPGKGAGQVADAESILQYALRNYLGRVTDRSDIEYIKLAMELKEAGCTPERFKRIIKALEE